MTDAHCHLSGGEAGVREFLCGRDFVGHHPWEADDPAPLIAALRARLVAEPTLGVGEIGLDRLRRREISPLQRELFELQLELALELNRPVVLHGAKCWGEVVKTVKAHIAARRFGANRPTTPSLRHPVTSFLFHGFSRSDGLIPEIVALGGFISVGPTILNDHAVNYREMVKKIPLDRLLVETDRTVENAATCPPLSRVLAALASTLGVDPAELERITDENASRFLSPRR